MQQEDTLSRLKFIFNERSEAEIKTREMLGYIRADIAKLIESNDRLTASLDQWTVEMIKMTREMGALSSLVRAIMAVLSGKFAEADETLRDAAERMIGDAFATRTGNIAAGGDVNIVVSADND